MSRELIIMRHAKSAWDTDAPTDFERPLAKRGKKEAPRVGKWLRVRGGMPDYVVSSPAIRAKQTALKVCRELGIEEKQVTWEPRIYDASTAKLLEVLADCPETAKRVLLVGHNPGLESLLAYLCGERLPTPEDDKLLPTAAVACLEMPAEWQGLEPGVARLISITRSRSLPES